MSQFQQPQYQQPGSYQQPQYSPPPTFVPQANGGQPGESLQQRVAKGDFPYLNRSEVVGQIFGMGQNTGIKWKDGQNGGEGHLEIELKLRKAWGGQNPGVKQSKVKLIAYGQLGQQLMNQVRTGMIVRAVGEIKVSNFKYNQGPKAGQWATTCQIQLRGGQNTEVPFEVLGGPLPVVDEAPRQQGGYQQGGYQQNNGGGYQQGGQQGGYQQGGYQQPQQQYQQQAPMGTQGYQGQAPPAQQAAPQFQQPQYQQQAPQAPQFQQPGQPVYQQPAQGQPVYQQPQVQQQFQQPVQGHAPQGPIGAPPGQPGGTFLPPPGQPQGQGAQQGNFPAPR